MDDGGKHNRAAFNYFLETAETQRRMPWTLQLKCIEVHLDLIAEGVTLLPRRESLTLKEFLPFETHFPTKSREVPPRLGKMILRRL